MGSRKPSVDSYDPHPGFQEIGEAALQDHRYQAAKDAFDLAFAQASKLPICDPNILIGILDLRVEAQLKLKDFDDAVKDARNMVRRDRADARGYLRCGQLFRMKKDFTGAQEWYKRGLQNVAKTHNLYHILESMSLKSLGKNVSTQETSHDPLTILPMDLICMVFAYLEFWEITSCLRVSKPWRNTLLATHSLWRTLDFLGTKKDVTVKNVRACTERLAGTPTVVRLANLKTPAARYLCTQLIRWRGIEHLRLHHRLLWDWTCSWDTMASLKSLHFGQECPISYETVCDLLHSSDVLQKAQFDCVVECPSLKRISWVVVEDYSSEHQTPFPALRHLALKADGKAKFEILFIRLCKLLHDFPNLEEFHCTGFGDLGADADLSTFRRLRHLSLEDTQIGCNNLKLPNSLEILACKNLTPSISPVSTPDFKQQVEDHDTLSNLTVLRVERSPYLLTPLLQVINKSSVAALTSIDLDDDGTVLPQLMTLVDLGKLARLTFLRIADVPLTDNNVQSIADCCSMLENVEFSALKVTGVAIKNLCTRTTIKELKLTNCCNISADAIEWARAKGILVIVNITQGGRKKVGRRVRYGS